MRITLILAALTACGRADLTGVWEGSCTAETGKGPADYALVYELMGDRDEVGGDAIVQPPFLTEPITGELTGTWDRRADAVELTVELGDPAQNLTVRHELAYDRTAATMEGPCTVQAQQEAPYDGDSTLSRTGDLVEP